MFLITIKKAYSIQLPTFKRVYRNQLVAKIVTRRYILTVGARDPRLPRCGWRSPPPLCLVESGCDVETRQQLDGTSSL